MAFLIQASVSDSANKSREIARTLKRDYPGKAHSQKAQHGFTLIELVIVMVMLGVLSVLVVPRPFDDHALNARAFQDQTQAFVRYAQKTAIAQRRTVCLAFTTQSVVLTIASQSGSNACSADLTGPEGQRPALLAARTGAAYDSAPAPFSFNGLGQPVDDVGAALPTQTWQVASMAQIMVVEAVTGYVHE